MKQKYYVTTDFHGYLTELLIVLDKFEEYASKDIEFEPVFINLGDNCDRGPDSSMIYETFATDDHPFLKRCKIKKYMMANHEQMFLGYLAIKAGGGRRADLDNEAMFLMNGGKKTIKSYYKHFPEKHIEKQFQHGKWIRENCKMFFDDGKYFFVHAGIDPLNPIEQQLEFDFYWIRGEFLTWDKPYKINRHVIHGHTPRNEVEVLPNRTNLDTGGCFEDGFFTGLILNPETNEREYIKVRR